MKSIDYLDAVKAKLGIRSDYAIAPRLGLTKQAVSALRRGVTMGNTTAARVAELLELDPLGVIADIELERAKTAEARSVWEKIAKRVAAGVLVAIGASIAPTPASAAASPGGEVAGSVYYVKSRRRWWFPLLPMLDPGEELLT